MQVSSPLTTGNTSSLLFHVPITVPTITQPPPSAATTYDKGGFNNSFKLFYFPDNNNPNLAIPLPQEGYNFFVQNKNPLPSLKQPIGRAHAHPTSRVTVILNTTLKFNHQQTSTVVFPR